MIPHDRPSETAELGLGARPAGGQLPLTGDRRSVAAFRIHKTDLSIRPIWHQKQERVQAHLFVCFLAYVLWKTLEQWQSRAGLGNSPRTLLEELHRLESADIILPTAEAHSRELRLRCVVRPDKTQAALLDRLGLRLPERLRQHTPAA